MSIEIESFLHLYDRHQVEQKAHLEIEWQKVSCPRSEQIMEYEALSQTGETKVLQKLAVLKVNGGLGTSMELSGAKGALEVQHKLSFIDLAIQQIEQLNSKEGLDVPLLFMTSFNTEEDTKRIVKKYIKQPIRISVFNQSRYPRLDIDESLPIAHPKQDSQQAWYPPGHGDLYGALVRSGMLNTLLSQGKEYLFVSNSDNLGATVDPRILNHMDSTQSEFVMEVTDKTKADIKGGTLVDYDGTIRLLELAQIPLQHVEEFTSAKNFRIFNTNNLWIHLPALKRVMERGEMQLDIIANHKIVNGGQTVLQLETAAGAAIKHFKNARGLNVPRSRFLPVKTCSDLLLVRSDLFKVEGGSLVTNEHRMFATVPLIKLGDHFKNISQFQKRFRQVPSIVDLDHLTVSGDVYFGRNVTLRGTVIIIANEGQVVHIPDGCVLENRLISGNLTATDL
ncbi:UTP--glucose-1-phosphate uridylyltransferase [Coprinopsis marcescibilis]|uniref:UTP--glucose-1-phosphate uridylyltransferase n=1 Tax=Coprinopsis marcescibilis TaxID=230819 RepID=A0A5C3KYG2_COPMA|nr:UTP--glucose-1-phosphate uridylyltransferase [Coprinopsis marcescibilis]